MQAEEVRADLSERGDTSLNGCGARELRAQAESCDVRNKTRLCQNEQWPSEGVGSEAETSERVSHCPRRRTRRQSGTAIPICRTAQECGRYTFMVDSGHIENHKCLKINGCFLQMWPLSRSQMTAATFD